MGIENSGVSVSHGKSEGTSSFRLASAVADAVSGITDADAASCDCRMEECMCLQTALIARYSESVRRSFDEVAFEWIEACSETFRKLFDSGKRFSLEDYEGLLTPCLSAGKIH